MTKKLILLVAASLAANVGWTASNAGDSSSKEERIGFGSGAAVGALAGPLGIVFGATAGAILGDRFHQAREGRREAEERLGATRAETDSLHERLGGSERELARLRHELTAQRETQRAAIERALDLEVLFKTAASTVEAGSAQRLARLGQMLAGLDGVVVALDGFADVRGDDRYNTQLSAERAAAVKDILVAAGVPADRVVVSAQGESAARAGADDADGLALDRRVHLSVYTERDADRVARQ